MRASMLRTVLLLLVLVTASVCGLTMVRDSATSTEYGPGQVIWGTTSVIGSQPIFQSSNRRIFHGFGFNIPTGSIIDGIHVRVTYNTALLGIEGRMEAESLSLRDPGGVLISGSNEKSLSTVLFENAGGSYYAGSSSDDWGLTGSASSLVAAINDPDFGVSVVVRGYVVPEFTTSLQPLKDVELVMDGRPSERDYRDENELRDQAAAEAAAAAKHADAAGDRRPAPDTWRVTVAETGVAVTVYYHAGSCSATGEWPTTSAGTTANLGCDPGYSGTYSRYCTSSATWDPIVDTCSLITNYCSLLGTPSNGAISIGSCSTRRSIGEVCGTFSCNAGFTLVGSSSRTCAAGPSWSGSTASCSLTTNYCSLLSPPSNGAISIGSCSTRRSIGEVCGTFSCNAGYTLVGSSSRTCDAGPSWSGSAASCSTITNYCPLLSPPSNGVISIGSCSARRSIGEVCGTFSCNAGYSFTGSSSRTCGAGAVWSGSAASCALISNFCPPPPPPPANGATGSCSRSVGGTCSYSCNEGYEFSGASSISCLTSGSWSGTPSSCVLDTTYCPSLTHPSNGQRPSSYSRTLGAVASPYTCNAGYDISGSSSRTCMSGGSWSGSTPSCQLDSTFCPSAPSAPSNARLLSCTRSIGGSCSYACNHGYETAGSTSLSCSSSATWSGTLGSCSKIAGYCPALPDPANGANPSSYSRVVGSVASPYTCNAGYIITAGSTSRTCEPSTVSVGTWSGSTPTCGVDTAFCVAAPPPPPNFSIVSCSSGLDDVCIYGCDNGYTLSGNDRFTCLASTAWGGTLGSCGLTPGYCSALPIPSHATRGTCTGTLGSSCGPVSCNAGYIRSGSATRTCEDAGPGAGSWSGLATSCSLDTAYCPTLTPPAQASLGSCARSIGGTCSFACANGYEPSGSASLTCQAGGTWSGSFGSCVRTTGYCSPLTAPTNGAAPSCLGRIDDSCGPSTCNEGFLPSGSATRTCNDAGPSAGSWDGSAFSCGADGAYCPLPSVPDNAALGSCGQSIGGSCSMSCNNGYSTTGTTTVTCAEGPVWSAAYGSCSADAGYCAQLPAPPNSVVPTCTGEIGSSCGPAYCNAGYNVAGSATRTCTDNGPTAGTWGGSPLTCTLEPNYCTIPAAPANGLLGSCTLSIGGTCTYSCDNGYQPSGAQTITCEAGPAWSAALGSCVKKPGYCPAHPPLPDGTNPVCTGVIGEQCGPFTCNTGYVIAGTTERTCLEGSATTGTWSNDAPLCVVDGDYCVAGPAAPGNGTRGTCQRFLGGTCSFACNNGYGPSGSTTLTCQASTAWSDPAPTCSPVNNFCSPFSGLENGGVPVCNNRILEPCGPFTCDPGFSLFGDATLVCGETGDWIGEPPFCSSTDPALSLVFSPSSIVVSADGSGWNFFVQPRTALNDTLVDSQDIVSVLLASAPPSITAPSLAPPGVWRATNAWFEVSMAARNAGSYSLNVLINGVPIGSSPYSLTVLPGAPAASTSVASGQGLGVVTSDDELFSQGQTVQFNVVPYDAYDNTIVVADGATNSPFTATLKGDGNVLYDVTYVAAESGVARGYVFEYSVPQGGLFTLSVALGGIPIGGSPWLVQVRAVCEPGSQLVRLTGPCVPCESNTYASDDTLECLPCPAGMASAVGSARVSNCSCVPGYYANENAAVLPEGIPPCSACPVGATCPGGSSRPFPQPGYYTVDSQFVACPQPSACVGSGRCARGYSGSSCSDCESGYYRLGSKCYECDQSKAALVIIACLVAITLFVGLLVYLNSRESHNRMYTAAAFMIGFNSLQISAMYGEIELEWHPIAKDFFNVLSVANLNLELTSPECSVNVGNPWLFKWLMTLLLPVIMLGILGIVFCCGALYRLFVKSVGESWGTKHPKYFPPGSRPRGPDEPMELVQLDGADENSLKTRAKYRFGRLMSESVLTTAALRQATVRTFFQLFIFAYLPLAAATLRFFECERVAPGSSDFVMASAPAVACYDSQYWMLLWVAIVFVLLYAVGIPVATFALLRARRARFDDVEFHLKYGFLVARFKPNFYAFEVGIMCRKLLVVLAIVAFQAPDHEAIMAALVLVASLVHVSHSTPYAKLFHNRLSMGALFTSCVVLFGGTLSSARLRNVLVLGGLAANVLIILYGMLHEFRAMLEQDEKDMAELVTGDENDFEMAVFDDQMGSQAETMSATNVTTMEMMTLSTTTMGGGVGGTGTNVVPVNPVFGDMESLGSMDDDDDDDGTSAFVLDGPPLPGAPARPAPHMSSELDSFMLMSGSEVAPPAPPPARPAPLPTNGGINLPPPPMPADGPVSTDLPPPPADLCSVGPPPPPSGLHPAPAPKLPPPPGLVPAGPPRPAPKLTPAGPPRPAPKLTPAGPPRPAPKLTPAGPPRPAPKLTPAGPPRPAPKLTPAGPPRPTGPPLPPPKP